MTQGGFKRHCTTLSSFCDTGNQALDINELEVNAGFNRIWLFVLKHLNINGHPIHPS